ncbi:MAG: hypothetical protein M1335_06815, partial [Chloroflexi bacterium]|nr:hypothetical protein [Chloroflexota bacterium]
RHLHLTTGWPIWPECARKQLDEEMSKAKTRLESITVHNDQIVERVELMIEMAANCYLVYKKGKEQTKRLFNETFFKKIYVKNQEINDKEFSADFHPILSRSSSKIQMVGEGGLEPPWA